MDRPNLSELEQMVLWTVLRQAGEGYGVSIAEEIEERAGRSLSLGSLYALLDRLHGAGLLSARQGEPTAERGGRAKRHFAVTERGLEAAQDARRRMEAIWEGLPAEAGR